MQSYHPTADITYFSPLKVAQSLKINYRIPFSFSYSLQNSLSDFIEIIRSDTTNPIKTTPNNMAPIIANIFIFY